MHADPGNRAAHSLAELCIVAVVALLVAVRAVHEAMVRHGHFQALHAKSDIPALVCHTLSHSPTKFLEM